MESAMEEYERQEEESEAALVDMDTQFQYRPPTPRAWQVYISFDISLLIICNYLGIM
jgi:hypothetical protein